MKLNIYLAFIIAIIFIMVSLQIVESFGSTSPGTMVQLNSTRAPRNLQSLY
jgi:hypothetical protein